MWFMGKETVDRYDKFKGEIFGNKKDEFKQKYKQKRAETRLSEGTRPTNHPFFRKLMILTVLSTGFYFANQKFKIMRQLLTYIESYNLNPIYLSALRTLYADVQRKFSTNPEHHTLSETKNSRFANSYFQAQLNFYLKTIKERNVSKIVTEQTNSNLSFGPFKISCRHQRLRVDEEGNVVRESQKSKLRVGGLNVIGSKVTEILEHQNTTNVFLKYKDFDINGSCKAVNFVNYLLLSREKYEEIYEECRERSTDIYGEIRRYVEKSDQRQKKGKHKSYFLFSLS